MTDKVSDQQISDFLDTLASNAPTPGGGSVAALNGAMAAALLGMVCSIMLSRNGNTEQKEELETLKQRIEELRYHMQELAQADIEVFNRLSAAYKLPRTTDADAASRRAAIQRLTREAAEVPLQTAHSAAALLPLCITLAHKSTRLLLSDVGIAAVMARATVQSSLLNVAINLATLEDHIYVTQVRTQTEKLMRGLEEETTGILEIVYGRIKS